MLTIARHRHRGRGLFNRGRQAVLLSVALAASGFAAGGRWFEATPLPGPRAFHATAVVRTDSGLRLYAIGGQRSPADTMERLCVEYSPQSNSWRQRAAMRVRRGLGQACGVDGHVWMLGGCRTFGTGLADVEEYDPDLDEWTVGPNMPESMYDFGAAVWRDSLVFVLGGGSWHPSKPPTDALWLFDPANRAWQPATPLPEPLGAATCGIVGDTILVATGWTGSGPTNRAWLGLIDTAHPGTIGWRELDTLPGPRRCRAAGGVADGRLYVIGGLALSGSDTSSSLITHRSSLWPTPFGFRALAEVWSFEPDSGRWQVCADKPTPVSCVYGTGSDGAGRIYVPGGYSGAAPYIQTTEFLDLSSYQHDVGVECLVSPSGRLMPGDTYAVSVRLRNFGTAVETLSAHVTVLDSASQIPVFSGDTILILARDSAPAVGFGSFVPVTQAVYRTTAYVVLAGDENPDNDTIRGRARTTSGSDPDGFGYTYESSQEPDSLSFSWFNPAGGTVIDNWDPNPDEGTSRRRLPFDFHFYGDSTDRVYVCTNGCLQTTNSVVGLNFPFPYEGMADIIAPFWDDLTLLDAGQVYENFTADRAVYTWVNARRAKPDTGHLTFQAVLERGGDIRFNYLDVTADATSSTVGIQGRDGSWNWYQEYVYDGEPFRHVPADSTSIWFHAPRVGVTEQYDGEAVRPSRRMPSVLRGQLRLDVDAGARTVQVFNACGRLVRTLLNSHSPLSAPHRLSWDRRDQQARLVPAGAYFIRVASTQGSLTRKTVLLD